MEYICISLYTHLYTYTHVYKMVGGLLGQTSPKLRTYCKNIAMTQVVKGSVP